MIVSRRTHRALGRIADRLPFTPGASARFDDLVVKRKSWGYWFVARVALAAAVAGCGPRVDRMDEDSIKDRSELVRICQDGTKIARDPVSRRLVWNNGWASGLVAPAVTLGEVCK